MNAKYQIDTPENKQFLTDIVEDLLKFGRNFPAPDGTSYYLGDDGTPWTERPRECFITCRMAHIYSIGHFLGYPGSKELAAEAIKGLRGKLHDDVNGGWYPGVYDNDIVPDKMCYAHAFVILAATSGILAGIPESKELLDDALEVYDRFFWNEEEGLSCDIWNTEFTVCDDYRGLNANMHTVEAFLAVADVAGLEEYRIRCGRIINRVLGWASKNEWRIPEHFYRDWTANLDCNKENPDDPFKPYGATPGHGMEWSRLITQWALSTFKDDTAAAPYIEAAENLFNRAVADAWNVDGQPGLVYSTDWDGKPVVRDRMHWTLGEAVGASSVLYHVTKKEKYANDYAEFWAYIDEYMLDKVNGSWYHQLDCNNQPSGTVWPGKMDLYHAAQAALFPRYAANVSIAAAVKNGALI